MNFRLSSLESYNQFVCDWVKEVFCKEFPTKRLVVGKVVHSQRLQQKPLTPWTIADSDGSILSSHCDCVAGLGETCSHVGALLFAIDDAVRSREVKTVTSVKAYWKLPYAKAGEMAKSRDIDYTGVKKKFSMRSSNQEVPPRNLNPRVEIPTLTTQEVREGLAKLFEENIISSLHTAMELFCNNKIQNDSNENLNGNLEKLFRTDNEFLTLEQLLEIDVNISLTDEDCNLIKSMTVEQSRSFHWFVFSSGRITASRFKACTRTKIENPSISLIEQICYPVKKTFKTHAAMYGCHHEKSALEVYIKEMSSRHENLVTPTCGLIINSSYPHMGASPDALVDCLCCGKGCVEIKCPYWAKDIGVAKKIGSKNFCIQNNDGRVLLGPNHSYYYQMQMQMALTDRNYCDFVVWSPTDIYFERVLFCEEFWHEKAAEATIFLIKS